MISLHITILVRLLITNYYLNLVNPLIHLCSSKLVKALHNQQEWPDLSPTLQDITHLLHFFTEAKVIFNYVPKLYFIVQNWVKQDVEKELV